MRVTSILAASAAICVGGCVNKPSMVVPTTVPVAQFLSLSCPELMSERERIQDLVVRAGGRLEHARGNEQSAAVAGLLVVWPALFVLGASGDQERQFARLKGEYEAINQALNDKNCSATGEVAEPAIPPQP